jgi:hypothetical protein
VIAREDNPYFIKLLDFGIAQLRGQGAVAGLTLVGSVMGTPQYMSPEQISGGTVDARSDVWAMGVMMYRAATGQAPYKGEEFAELADKILHTVPQPAGELVVMPAALAQLIASCLARRVEDRCPSIVELIAGLARVKQACQLDDDAILAAVKADSGAIRERLPARRREPTRDSIAGSMPKFQDDRGPGAAVAPAAPPARRGVYLAFAALAVAGGTLEQQATEVRHLQRTEVREAEEPFTAGQKGSSAMPHKRNPILSENLTGLARLLRSYALAALEDVALWHERDISHSSVERVIGPDATIALDFALQRFARMIEDLRVYPERMKENLELTGGLYEAQRVLLALVGKGVGRQEGYVYVQRNAMKVWEEKVDFRTALKRDPDVRKVLSEAEIDACFALDYHLKHVDTIFRRVFGEA